MVLPYNIGDIMKKQNKGHTFWWRGKEYTTKIDLVKQKQRNKYGRKISKELTDSYICKLIYKSSFSKGCSGLTREYISDEFIEMWRFNLKLKRALKLTPKLKSLTQKIL